MVIDKLLKVNSNDPKAEELRQRLAALQQKAQGAQASNQPRAGPTQPPTGTRPPPGPAATVTTTRGISDAELQRMGFTEQKHVIETREPEVRLKEERTLALVMTQIQEVINLHNESAKKIRDLEAKNSQLQKDLESFKDKHEELLQKMNSIDSRLEKFMGLYEVVTAQYNPFTNGHASTNHPGTSSAPAQGGGFTDALKAQLAQQASAKTAAPAPTTPAPLPKATPAKAGVFAVEDSLTQHTATVEVHPEDAAAADARFKRVEELLADLHEKHAAEKGVLQPTLTEAPDEVKSSLHDLLAGFELRLTAQIDSSLQSKLHERFTKLESNLQTQIRDALHDEIEAVQRDEDMLRQELVELQSLVQAREGPHRDALEDELAELQHHLGAMGDDIKAISPELYFRVKDGQILKDLADLRDALKIMSPTLFAHHVRADGNDFAQWVEHALSSPALAQLLREQKSADDMVKAIIAHDGMND